LENRLESLAITNQLTKFPYRLALTVAVLWLGLFTSASAQQIMQPPADHTNTDRQRQQDMSKREYQLRNFGKETNADLDDKQKKALMAQVEQDFDRILLLHNQMVRAISSDAPLDFHFVSEASAEIKKRSTRLQSTLGLRPSTSQKQDLEAATEPDGNQLKPALLTLCKRIKDFVTNPIIETPGTVDAEHLARAKRDLASVIEMSSLIRKRAEQHK
jgi:hypothetical protein